MGSADLKSLYFDLRFLFLSQAAPDGRTQRQVDASHVLVQIQ
jgi:hypothetical protein